VDLAGDLRGAPALQVGVDRAPEAHLAVGRGDVDGGGGQLRVWRLERLLHLGGELLVRIGLRRLGRRLWLRCDRDRGRRRRRGLRRRLGRGWFGAGDECGREAERHDVLHVASLLQWWVAKSRAIASASKRYS